MFKKILLLLVITQITISCSKNDDVIADDPAKDNSIEAQIAAINLLPYSALAPPDQKIKLENDANQMLTELDLLKSSSAIEAIQNLERLISINSIDYLIAGTNNNVQDLLSVSGAYGIYTWKNAMQVWVKTPSTSELKFVFPAKKTQTVNNTVFSSNGVSSTVKVEINDTRERGNYIYNPITNNYTYVILNPAVYDQFYLPSSVDSKLTIDNLDVATFKLTNAFSGNKQAPDDATIKIILNDGYTWSFSGKKGLPNAISNSLTFNGKNLIEFNTNSTANIDEILNNNSRPEYIGKANTLIKLLDNFLIVGQNDFEQLTRDQDLLKTSLVRPNYNTSTYYENLNIYKKSYSEGSVVAYNKNIKMALVSKKDGTKIADIIQKSEKGYLSSNYVTWVPNVNSPGGYWQYNFNNTNPKMVQNYDEVLYLRFKDNTDVAFDVYFSSGFENLETKFQNFVDSFNR